MQKNLTEYRLSPKAREDMEAVWIYSLNKWGQKQTNLYIDELTQAFLFLTNSPKAGKICENIRQGYRQYPVMRHVIYYKTAKYGIKIIRILHQRMLTSRHL